MSPKISFDNIHWQLLRARPWAVVMNGTWFLSSRHLKSIRETKRYKVKLFELQAINRKANSTSLSLKTAYTPGKESRVPFIMERRKAEIQA